MAHAPKHTVESVADLVRKNIESRFAEAVLDALKPLNGELITTRLLDKLPGGRVEWRLSRTLGYTEIRNRSYVKTGGAHREGVSLIIAHSELTVPLDVGFVERENPAYFAGRRERNKLREQALSDQPLLTRVAVVMNEIEDINQQRSSVRRKFSSFLETGEPLSPDQYELERACGLREDNK